jgi:hypothetical protein
MRSAAFLAIFLSSSLWGQTPPKDTSSLPPETTIITIIGLCPGDTATPIDATHCRTTITRKQFEQMIDAVQPDMDADTRKHLATAYPQFLTMAHEAENRGLDKTTRFEERMAFARLQILSQELVHEIQDEAAKVPDADIAAYYGAHKSDFEEANLERIIIPLRRETKPGAGTDEMKQEAATVHARAVAGENFVALQKDVFDFAGVSGNTSPNPKMAELRRRGLPPAHVSVFDLKPGEISPVITDAGGYYVYKVDSKEVLPLDKVKNEITVMLRRSRTKSMVEAVQKPFTVEVNDQYFDAKKK